MQDFIGSVNWIYWDCPDGISVYPDDSKLAENTIMPINMPIWLWGRRGSQNVPNNLQNIWSNCN